MKTNGPPKRGRAVLASFALYAVLAGAVVLWALLIWHPWIDWFGRPRP